MHFSVQLLPAIFRAFLSVSPNVMANAPSTVRPLSLKSGSALPNAPQGRKLWQLVVMVSLWLATVGNIALWRAIANLPQMTGTAQWILSGSLGAAIACLCAALLFALGWGRAAKLVMIAFCWIAAFAAYFMLNYGIAIDSSMLVNVLQTDVREAADLLHWTLFATVAVIAIPPTWWLLKTRLQTSKGWRGVLRQLGLVVLSVAAMVAIVFLAFRPISSVMRNHTQLRYMMNPIASVYAAGHLVAQKIHQRDTTIYPIGEDAKLGASYASQSQYPLYVLVVGETGRAGNFATNGYNRPTTPLLSARKDLAIAQDAWSCGTNTAVSVPCMFSHLGRSGLGSSKSYESLLDVLQRAGLAVLWVDNQSGCKGVCDRVAKTNTLPDKETPADKAYALMPAQKTAWCQDGECVDMALLEGLDERIAALPAEQRNKGVVLVLHQMGSHGPAYFKRSKPDDKQFLPECTSVSLQSCDRESLVNAYDNSIIATDRMLGGLLQWLEHKDQRQPTAMVYVADHGESLGENNIYLHGLPYSVAPDVQKHIPWITWLSPAMQQRTGVSTACLQQSLGTTKISHDNYFHSVLGLADVQTKVRDPQLDLFAACAASAPASSTLPAPTQPTSPPTAG